MRKRRVAPLLAVIIALTIGCWSNKLDTGQYSPVSMLSIELTDGGGVDGYTVVYEGNGSTGGTVPVDSATYLDGDPVSVLDNTGGLNLSGYNFAGWNTDPAGTGTELLPGMTFVMGTEDVTLYAMWDPASYMVTYDDNGSTGGTVPLDNNTYLSGENVTVLGNTGSLERYGSLFLGWNTRADGTGTSYVAGSSFTMGTADVTLYADWYMYFAGGDGTTADPFQVATAEHLNNVRYFLDAHFVQTADIDLGVAPYNSGSGWEPVGSNLTPFIGTYDGGNFHIANLYINRNTENNIGLFGYADGAVLQNVVLDVVNVAGNQYVGGLIGYYTNISQLTATAIGNPLIGNCSVSGATITGNNDVGGLAGYNRGSNSPAYISVIENCFVIGTVTGTTNNTGGLVGQNVYYGTISESYAAVTVNGGSNYSGGMTGYTSYTGKIYNSYATGSVTGINYVGGLTGYAESSAVNYCYAACAVNGIADVGGLIGYGGSSTLSSYYDSTVSGQSDTGKGIPEPTTLMTQQSTFLGWNFTSTWDINKGASYPYLQWQGGVNIPVP